MDEWPAVSAISEADVPNDTSPDMSDDFCDLTSINPLAAAPSVEDICTEPPIFDACPAMS